MYQQNMYYDKTIYKSNSFVDDDVDVVGRFELKFVACVFFQFSLTRQNHRQNHRLRR